MALCRFEAKIISRSGGRSTVGAASYRTGKCATSAAAYRAGAELTDERTGVTYDYSRKRGVMGAEIMLPEGAPAWMQDRAQLWNAVEKAEKRADAQLARDYILTLPHELDAEQRRALTRAFVRQEFVDKGYVADIAWHAPHGQGDERNHHAHVMVVMRRIEDEGFARKKERAPEGTHPAEHWKQELRQQRAAWAQAGGDALDRAGFVLEAERFRLGHLTLEKQRDAAQARGDRVWVDQLDREAEPKQGPLATKLEQQGRESLAGNDRRAVQARNAERSALRLEQVALEAEIIDLEAERAKRAGPSPADRTPAEPTPDRQETEPTRTPGIGATIARVIAEQAAAPFQRQLHRLEGLFSKREPDAGTERQRQPEVQPTRTPEIETAPVRKVEEDIAARAQSWLQRVDDALTKRDREAEPPRQREVQPEQDARPILPERPAEPTHEFDAPPARGSSVEEFEADRHGLTILSGGARVFNKLADIIADILTLGDGSAPAPGARNFHLEQLEARERSAEAMENIRLSLERSNQVNVEDLRQLPREHLVTIASQGEPALRELMRRDDESRERDWDIGWGRER